MFKIFRGNWRGINAHGDDEIFVNIGVNFRQHLHHFKGAKLHVFLAITLHMDKDGHAFPSYETLQKETGYGRDTIARALDELCNTTIEGQPVLMRWRERDDKGKFTGSNHYIIFPTNEEFQNPDQSPENPTLEKPNSGEPDSKDNQLVGKPKPKAKEPEADASGPAPTVFELRSRAMDALKESTNVTSVVVGFAVDVFGEDVKDYGRAGKEIRRVKDKLGISYRAAAEEIIGCLAAAGEMEPRPANVWDYIHGIVRTRTKDAKPAPREYVPTHVDVYVPPADVVNPVRRKETAA